MNTVKKPNGNTLPRMELSKKPQTMGKHYIVEFYDCCSKTLNSVDKIQEIMLQAAVQSGATIVEKKFHKFSPQGVSGIILISESHLSIHTWPEFNYAAFDLFSCSSTLDSNFCINFLKEKLSSKSQTVKMIERGF